MSDTPTSTNDKNNNIQAARVTDEPAKHPANCRCFPCRAYRAGKIGYGELIRFRAAYIAPDAEPVAITYTNWRGETAERTIIPQRLWFGSTEWHPEPQWLISARDVEKGVERDFALSGFAAPLPAKDADPALAAYKAENAKHGWTGRGYAFDPFFLNLNKDGGGSIGFNEDDAHWEQDDESSRQAIYCNVSPGEMIELRDALNKAFPAKDAEPEAVTDARALLKEAETWAGNDHGDRAMRLLPALIKCATGEKP